MVGSYVDRYFEGTLDAFKSEHTEMFKKDGNLKAEYVKADALIQRAERDELFMKYMSGEKQVIMTAELYGTPWKIKMDSYIPVSYTHLRPFLNTMEETRPSIT